MEVWRCGGVEVWKVWRRGGVEGVEVWKVWRCGRCGDVEEGAGRTHRSLGSGLENDAQDANGARHTEPTSKWGGGEEENTTNTQESAPF